MKTFSQICKILEAHGWSNGRGIYFGGCTSWSYTRNNRTVRIQSHNSYSPKIAVSVRKSSKS